MGKPTFGFFILSRDAKLAMVETNLSTLDNSTVSIIDVSTGQVLRQLPRDTSVLGMVGFSPDSKALVRIIVLNGGSALLYQPIDGSPTHVLLGPTHEELTAFGWSPSGKLLAVLQQRKSSDVVLIKDLAGGQAH